MATKGVTAITQEKLSKFKRLTKNICDKIELDSAAEDFHSACLPTDDFKRWEKIVKNLTNFMRNPRNDQFHKTILSYNEGRKGSFEIFEHYVRNYVLEETAFNKLLGDVAAWALKLPDLCKQPIMILTKELDVSVTLSEAQIFCLLCNAFFCTFPDTRRGKSHLSRSKRGGFSPRYAKESSIASFDMPTINFFSLFEKGRPWNDDSYADVKSEKLECILQYFRTMLERCHDNTGARKVTFHRQVLTSPPDWTNSEKDLRGVDVFNGGFIENATSLLQVDFANKMVGGGVLSKGCVQEEIRFVICPELIISRLITEELGDLECLIVTGVEQFSKYSGYAGSFKFEEGFEDNTPMDKHGRRMTQVLVMDALNFSYEKEQFDQKLILRELNKAYCGLKCDNIEEYERPAVATGNWGCGVFNGNKELKFIIQLLAASEAGRDVCYFTFGDRKLVDRIQQLHEKLKNHKFTVGKLFCKVNEAIESDTMTQRKEVNFFDHLGIMEAMDFSKEEDRMDQNDEDDSNTVSKENLFIKDYES